MFHVVVVIKNLIDLRVVYHRLLSDGVFPLYSVHGCNLGELHLGKVESCEPNFLVEGVVDKDGAAAAAKSSRYDAFAVDFIDACEALHLPGVCVHDIEIVVFLFIILLGSI